MRYSTRVLALALVCLVGGVASVHAQDETDPSQAARFRFGALRFTPSIAVSNLGVDNNVFNETVDPKQDTTAAVGPAVNLWLKMGKSRLSGKASGQYLYFNKYDNQRAWNTANEGRWELPLSRMTPYVIGSLSSTKDRPGYEIASRVRMKQRGGGVGTAVRLSGKTTLELSGRRTVLDYDDQDLVLGSLIAQTLNRRTDLEEAGLRVRLTPLTTFVVRGEAMQDRFDNEVSRNADSFSVVPGFEFKPAALISGTAFVGMKRFNALREEVPDFTGVVANVSTKYIIRTTQFDVRVARDLAYSFEILQPYYALTDTGLSVTQRVTRKWDIVGRTSRQTMAYRAVRTATNLAPRTDRSWLAGGGFGYRLAETLRFGIDANYYRRNTVSLAFGNFEGLRVGATFSYGLTQ